MIDKQAGKVVQGSEYDIGTKFTIELKGYDNYLYADFNGLNYDGFSSFLLSGADTNRKVEYRRLRSKELFIIPKSYVALNNRSSAKFNLNNWFLIFENYESNFNVYIGEKTGSIAGFYSNVWLNEVKNMAFTCGCKDLKWWENNAEKVFDYFENVNQ